MADPTPVLTAEHAPVLIADLLCGPDTLAHGLSQALARGDSLDAYLFAAGLSQLAEDRLHPDPMLMFRAASYLRGHASRPARLAGAAAGGAGALARARAGAAHRRLLAARHTLASLTLALAGQVLGLAPGPEHVPDSVLAAVPDLAGEVVRLPACFRDFDQHPDDVVWLAAEFRRWLAAHRAGAGPVPLCVVGVRTSGSYLAPLHAALLRAAHTRSPDPGAPGPPMVEMLTYRPGRPFLRWERDRLAAVARAGGVALVTDDPPGSGESLADAASAVARAGFGDRSVVVGYSSFGTGEDVPPRLGRWPTVVQPWREWSIHRRCDAARAGTALAALTGGEAEVVHGHARTGQDSHRGHVRARFTVRLSGRPGGVAELREVLAEGAGLGYFGRQSLAVAAAVPGRVPHVYGFADGLVFRDWLPCAVGAASVTGADDSDNDHHHSDNSKRRERGMPGGGQPANGLAATIAGYVAARREALPAPASTAARLRGRAPAWEVAAMLLSGQYGPLGVPARPLLLEPLVRRLLAHDEGSVPDGKTDARHWLPGPAQDGGGLRKVDFHQRSFGHLDLACADPVFDLAGAAADPPDPRFQARLRDAYEAASGQLVDDERWLLYRLTHVWRLERAADLGPAQARQRSAAAVHDYLAGLYLRDLPDGSGPLCAVDLDGVLECGQLGYPASSPTGMLALRALLAHGFRPVLVSGRSLPEVRERCEAFGLAGGVAEYGAALWLRAGADSAAGSECEAGLLTPQARALLARVRMELSGVAGVTLDPRYRHTVRATASGGPLPPEVTSALGSLGEDAIVVIHGDSQTDITIVGADKGTGMDALSARLSGAGCALAVGDSEADLPMLARASLARGPANSRFPPGSGVKTTRHAYQAGLADACADLLGHRPGRCPRCCLPEFPRRTRALLATLDLRANGLASIPLRTASVAALLARAW